MTFEESWSNVEKVLQDTFQLNNRRIVWLNRVRDQVRQLASGGISTAPDFTLHNEIHSDNVVLLIGRLAEHFKSSLSEHEYYLLAVAAYLHDVGMFFSGVDFSDRIYPNLAKILKFCPEDSCDSGVAYQEKLLGKSVDAQIRIVHHLLGALCIIEEGKKSFDLASPDEIDDIVTICRGHRKADLCSRGCGCYKTRPRKVGEVRRSLLAGILRLADALDFYPERTPEGKFRTQMPDLFKNPLALKHWLNHVFSEAVYISIDNQGGNRCLDCQIHLAVDSRRMLNGRSCKEFFTPLFEESLDEARITDFNIEQYPPSLLRLFEVEDIELTLHVREGAVPDKLPDRLVEKIEESSCTDILQFLNHLETADILEPTQNVMDRIPELQTFKGMLDGDDPQHRLALMVGGHGQGKTFLMETFHKMTIERHVPCVRVDLSDAIKLDDILDEIWRIMGPHHFPLYSELRSKSEEQERQMANGRQQILTECFFRDWRAMDESPALVILLDTFERASPTLKSWITQAFLEGLENIPQVVAIIGGRDWPETNAYWQKHGYPFPLEGVQLCDYKEYAEQRGVPFKEEELIQLHQRMNGLPKLFAELVEARHQEEV